MMSLLAPWDTRDTKGQMKAQIRSIKCGIMLIIALTSWLMVVPENSFALPSYRINTITFEQPETRKTILVFQEKDPSSVVLFDDDLPDDIFSQTDTGSKTSDMSISGILQMRGSLQMRQDDVGENNTSLRNRILVEAKYQNMLTLSGLSDFLYFGKQDQTDDHDLDLHEAKWEHTDKNYGFSLGRQIVRWGKTDQLSPVDTLNPEDLREFIFPEYEERKIPVWMAHLDLFFDDFTLEGVYIPWFEKSKIDYFQTNWSVFKHTKKQIQASLLPAYLKDYAANLQVHEHDPDTEAEFALRLSTTVKNIDLGVSFHRTTEDIPYIKNFPVKNIDVRKDISGAGLVSGLNTAVLTHENIEVEYKPTIIAGIEFETTLADFGLRGEAAWQENESFLTASLTSVRKPSFTTVLGADYTTAKDIYLNLQFAHRHIADYTSDILFFEQDTYTLLGEINRNIFSDWLNVSIHYSKTLNTDEWYISPRLKYTYVTNLECTLGAALFSGSSDTWFGNVRDFDLFFLDVSYRF
jgi:hypothetical protein